MRVFGWVYLALIALSCGGSTAKHGAAPPPGGGGNGGQPGLPGGAQASAGMPVTLAGDSNASGASVAGNASEEEAGESGTAGAPPQTFDEVCPSAAPRPLGGCAAGLKCSYGDDRRTWCRTQAACEDGVWHVTPGECPELLPCPDFTDGGDCGTPGPAVCRAPDERPCRCEAAQTPRWKCEFVEISAGFCPKPAPNEGTPCTEPEFDCYYAPCFGNGNLVAICTEGNWVYKETCTPL